MRTASGLLSAFVTLLVTIGPVETGAVFMGLTSGVHRPERRSLAVRAVLIAGGLLTMFTLGGVALLRLLHVSLPASASPVACCSSCRPLHTRLLESRPVLDQRARGKRGPAAR